MNQNNVSIVSCGIQSPTGTNAAMSIANVMAGICRKNRYPLIEDKKFVPVTLGLAEYLAEEDSSNKRMLDLTAPALEEVMEELISLKHPPNHLKVYLGLPSPRPGLSQNITSLLDDVFAGLKIRTGIALYVEYIMDDHDAGMIALSKTLKYLGTESDEFVLVGGVDSFVSLETVKWLEEQRWLKCSTNKNGFTPGEAAAFCLLCHQQTARQHGLPVMGYLLNVATVEEPHLPGSVEPTSGRGISTAINTVLESLADDELVDETFCTLKGLRREAEEYSFSIPRTGKKLKHPGVFISLATHWGDVGAASAPALVCYAIQKRSLGYADGGIQLIFTMSPGSKRSAALLKTV